MLIDFKRKALWFVTSFMGGGGGGGGDGGAGAREAERQAQINQGMANVNQAFTPFNDAYYSNISDLYKQHYTPLVTEQYSEAKRQLPFTFGNTQNSEYTRRMGELERDYERQQVDIGAKALDFGNQQRQAVESQRGSLSNQVTAGATPGTAASLADGAAKSLSATPAFSAIGDLFGKYVANAGNGAYQQFGIPGGTQSNTPLSFPGSGKAVTYVGGS